MQNCTQIWSIHSNWLVLSPALQIAHIWLLWLGVKVILVVKVVYLAFLLYLLASTSRDGAWFAMSLCGNAPVVIARHDGLHGRVTVWDVPMSLSVITSSSMGSLIGLYLAVSKLARGLPILSWWNHDICGLLLEDPECVCCMYMEGDKLGIGVLKSALRVEPSSCLIILWHVCIIDKPYDEVLPVAHPYQSYGPWEPE